MSDTSTADQEDPADPIGPNAWLVEEMYEQYLADASSVSPSWQEFFEDYRPPGSQHAGATRSTSATGASGNGTTAAPAPAAATPAAGPAAGTAPSRPEPATATPEPPRPEATPAQKPEVPGEEIRGVAKRIVSNMEASLAVPTATSYREVPAKLLEINRRVINGYLGRTRGGKVSFTHLIGYALVRALAEHVPAVNSSFLEGPDGEPRVVRNEHVGLGLAIDMEKSDGSRSLIVPCIRNAESMDFAEFSAAYDDIVRRAKTNKLGVDDFAGVTVTLTNPGTIGTERSVPRLMPGQGAIIGVGSLTFPTGFAGSDPRTMADLGVSKVITISSTYDHRIIQGAESGLLLKKLDELLLGADGFYDGIFAALGVPYEAVQWRQDVHSGDRTETQVAKQMQVSTLINMYRVRGHLIADLDPLSAQPPEMHSELDPATYGLTIWDLDRAFLTGGNQGIYARVGDTDRMALGDILHVLRDAYCRTVGIEYMHIQDPEEKRWIQEQVEGASTHADNEDQRHVLAKLNGAEALEKFLATKYLGQKRFGLEGAESLIPLLDGVLEAAADSGMDSAVIGMPHRGRLNVLVNIVGKAYSQLFREFEGYLAPDSIQGSGDVKYHLGQEGTFRARSGAELPLALAANPSHLEAVDPVVEGMVRARMDQIPPGTDPAYPVLPVLVHGDAAFAGQGVVAETLAMSQIHGYRVGGTIHVVVNNQLGFTTPPESARSSEYCTDVAKAVQAPIIHVNGDDPEACLRVARLAFAYRQRFHKDVVIDMVCYRRHGHNEGDDPSYTQPRMYRTIDSKRSVRKTYVENLVRRGDITLEEAESALEDFHEQLQAALDQTRSAAPEAEIVAAPHPPELGVLPRVDTGVQRAELERIYQVLDRVPDSFTMHPKLAKQFKRRTEMFEGGLLDWSLGETLALGSLLAEGTSVRMAGQDTRRGTFSQRHSTLFDFDTGTEYVPLRTIADGAGSNLWIYDSLLSEYAALGFEYGYSVMNQDALVLWEAQFGDFANGAQIIIDQFLVAAEDKWDQDSGLVLLLPHGYEGQGPEHSSARLERFLILCAEDNIQVCQPTNPAQYFHLLRRQVRRDVHKPLVVATPKSGLRDRRWQSPVDDLTRGAFEEVLPDPSVGGGDDVTRVVLASGKVAIDAIAKRDERGVRVPVVRVEQLYPWPAELLAQELERYPNCRELVWLQEEPENMGPWNFAKGHLYESFGDRLDIHRVSRSAEGSPATGSHAIHVQEQEMIMHAAFEPF
ncbi:MAG: multifunctional oxoglutarate decarboxylase/oxoglutarate dehydrogenase thiamine pyrophosphate-binding subunit/dihydrolipoyllysine-residue succinyltransferase subunit [Microthrixaceae bacterium]|nr:multifunctional oxoglutarate decarboxylase/oxoglutarate dehydrogenase thiamine pyrophosphate-binding subunit/dihydrolipoyllysine-residue succinyltransferase subunit [Microthrixaceae bacterium]